MGWVKKSVTACEDQVNNIMLYQEGTSAHKVKDLSDIQTYMKLAFQRHIVHVSLVKTGRGQSLVTQVYWL